MQSHFVNIRLYTSQCVITKKISKEKNYIHERQNFVINLMGIIVGSGCFGCLIGLKRGKSPTLHSFLGFYIEMSIVSTECDDIYSLGMFKMINIS